MAKRHLAILNLKLQRKPPESTMISDTDFYKGKQPCSASSLIVVSDFDVKKALKLEECKMGKNYWVNKKFQQNSEHLLVFTNNIEVIRNKYIGYMMVPYKTVIKNHTKIFLLGS